MLGCQQHDGKMALKPTQTCGYISFFLIFLQNENDFTVVYDKKICNTYKIQIIQKDINNKRGYFSCYAESMDVRTPTS